AELNPPQAAEIMQLGELQHLRTRITGRLRAGVGLFDLVAGLHPTPAVGGSPGSAARQWLRRHGDRRGAWYTGGVGWIDRDGDGEVVVALRCARIKGRAAELFAGAGIVAGSDPTQELAETEAKLSVISAELRRPRRVASRQTPRSGAA
ncbi:MAG TPA: chorismate-binding protein, partial [Accumulibacter sp.]